MNFIVPLENEQKSSVKNLQTPTTAVHASMPL